jgi:hypothetical protein
MFVHIKALNFHFYCSNAASMKKQNYSFTANSPAGHPGFLSPPLASLNNHFLNHGNTLRCKGKRLAMNTT